MKVEIVANGTVSFALIPENDMDRAAIKMLVKQNNEFIEITKQTQILNKASFTEGLVIQPKSRDEVKGHFNKISGADAIFDEAAEKEIE